MLFLHSLFSENFPDFFVLNVCKIPLSGSRDRRFGAPTPIPDPLHNSDHPFPLDYFCGPSAQDGEAAARQDRC